jgi:prepilin-type N-terminal cleavage/methylation domain-containing protein
MIIKELEEYFVAGVLRERNRGKRAVRRKGLKIVNETKRVRARGAKPSSASRGFTLIETVVVVGIVAIMTVGSFPGIMNSLETRALDGAGRDVLMAMQTAKWKAASDKFNYRVRFSQVGTAWKYQIEREAVSGTWTTAPGTLQKSIPTKFSVTVTLPASKDVIFTPTGFVSNCDSTKNSIMITSAKLASLSQQSNRTVKFYTGGSVLFLKS